MCAIVFVLSQCKNAGHVTYNRKYLLNVLFIPEVYIRYNDSFIRSTFLIRAMGCFLLWLFFFIVFNDYSHYLYCASTVRIEASLAQKHEVKLTPQEIKSNL